MLVVAAQNRQTHRAHIRDVVLNRLSMARASDFHRLDVFGGDNYVLSHLRIGQEVVGEQAKQRFARGSLDVESVRQLRDSLQKGRMLVVQLADVDRARRSEAKH